MAQGVDYNRDLSRVYREGRALSEATLAMWTEAAARHLADAEGAVLDLGAGTGRFSGALAARLGRPVVAVEPARGMRDQARDALAPGVVLVGARAEAIPLSSRSCALVWMSQAIHHVADLSACARELRRICADGARVLLRGMFDMTGWRLAPYFPAAVAMGKSQLPSLEAITEAFYRSGLNLLDHEKLDQVTVTDGEELLARTRLRADSLLARLSDEEFVAGVAHLEADVGAGLLPGPIDETLDLVAFA
jgi:SAM-dependent methyltransferase